MRKCVSVKKVRMNTGEFERERKKNERVRKINGRGK